MPSVSAPKSQPKIPTPPASTHDDDGHPLKKVCEIMEKKVRNLEKRKGKLDGYRQEAAQGKALNEDQKAAIARYDEVLNHLDLAREMVKTFAGLQADGEKAEKKRKKKEREERQARDLQVIKDVLLVQDVLNAMGSPTLRQTLLDGKTSLTVSSADLDGLDTFFGHVSIDRPSLPSTDAFQEKLTSASGHFFKLLEGKPKEIPNLSKTTYRQMKEFVFNVSTSGVFDPQQAPVEEPEIVTEQPAVPADLPEPEITVVTLVPQAEELAAPVIADPVLTQLPTAPIQGPPMLAQQTFVPTQDIGTDFNFLQESLLDQRPPVSSTMVPPPGHAMLPPSTHPRLDPAVVLVHSATTSTPNVMSAHPHLPYPGFLPVATHPPSPPPHIPMPPSHQHNIPFVAPVITQQYVNQSYAEPSPPTQTTEVPVHQDLSPTDVESVEQPKQQISESMEQPNSLNWGEEPEAGENAEEKQDDKNWSTFSARNDSNYEGSGQRRPYRGRGGGFRGGRGRGGYGGGYRNDNGNYRDNGNFRDRDNGGGYRNDVGNRYENRDREQGQGYRGGRGGFNARGGQGGAPRGRGNPGGAGGRGGRGGQGYDSNRQ